MLTAKPWKPEAFIRLLVSIFISYILGGLAMATTRYLKASHPINPWIFGALVAGSAIFCVVALILLHRSWDLALFARRFILTLACVYVGLTLGAFAQHYTGKLTSENMTVRTVIATLSFQGMALVFIWLFVREHRMRWRDAFGFSEHWKIAVILGVVVACIFLPVGQLLQLISAEVMSRMNVTPEVQPAMRALKDTVTWVDRATLGIVAIGLAPPAEEMLFRGLIYPAVKQAGFPRLALWGTSLLFAAVHWNLATFLPLFLLAIVLTLLYEKTGNLLAPITAHAIFNALNFAMFYVAQSKLGLSGQP